MFPDRSYQSSLCFFFLVLISLFTTQYLHGEDDTGGDGAWTVAVLRFKGEDLSIEQEQFRTMLPLYLVDEIERIPQRLLGPDDLKARAETIRKKSLRSLQITLNQVLGERDRAFLEQSETSDIQDLETKISNIREEIEETNNKEYEIAKEEKRTKVVLTDLNREGELHDFPDIGLEAWAVRNGYDCVVWGSLEQLEQLIYIEMKLMFTAKGETVTFYRGTFFGNDHMKPLREGIPVLRSLIYGDAWADIVPIVPPPVNARFIVDGREVFPDETGRIRNLKPGEHTVTVKAEGYFDNVYNFSLQEGEVKALELKMKEKRTLSVRIGSYPGEADVYIDSRFAGTTPLLIRNIIAPATAVIYKKGYHESIQVLDWENHDFDFYLHPEEIEIDLIIENARKRFYHGLAGFLLSLPLTILSYGKSSQYAYAYNSAVLSGGSSADETERLNSQSTMWYTAYLGSLFINSVLFTDTLLGMIGYIRSSQEQ